MNNLQERIKEAKSLGTGLILDKEDVMRLRVKEAKPKKNTPLQRMVDDLGARRIVVAGYCCLRSDCDDDCPLFNCCDLSNDWSNTCPELINEAYEILTEELG